MPAFCRELDVFVHGHDKKFQNDIGCQYLALDYLKLSGCMQCAGFKRDKAGCRLEVERMALGY